MPVRKAVKSGVTGYGRSDVQSVRHSIGRGNGQNGIQISKRIMGTRCDAGSGHQMGLAKGKPEIADRPLTFASLTILHPLAAGLSSPSIL